MFQCIQKVTIIRGREVINQEDISTRIIKIVLTGLRNEEGDASTLSKNSHVLIQMRELS